MGRKTDNGDTLAMEHTNQHQHQPSGDRSMIITMSSSSSSSSATSSNTALCTLSSPKVGVFAL
jgi:hypothetical protein